MDKVKMFILSVVGTMSIYLSNVFGVFTPLLWLTIFAMFADLATRCYAAGRREDEKIQSKLIMKGLYRKLGLCMLIVLTLVVDKGLIEIAENLGINVTTKVIFTALTLAWLFTRELISNFENLNHAGVELPKFLVKALNLAKDKVDNVGDSIVGGKGNENIH